MVLLSSIFIGDDFTISPYLVTFASDDIKKDITISTTVDMLLEFTETFLLYFEIAFDAKEIGVIESSPSIVTVTVLNNDS